MAKTKKHITQFNRNGQTQNGRVNQNLLPKNIKLDDKTVEDFIAFAKRYGPYIKYYDDNNSENGTWHPFFSKDLSAVLATVSSFPMDDYQAFYQDLKRFMLNLMDAGSIGTLPKHFRLFFQLTVWIVAKLSSVFHTLGANPSLKSQLVNLMENEMANPLEKVIAYFKGAHDEISSPSMSFKDIPITISDFSDPNLDIDIPDLVQDLLLEFQSFENAQIELPYRNDAWSTYFGSVAADNRPYVEGGTIKGKVYDALNYNLFIANMDAVLESMVLAISLFKGELKKSLMEYPKHKAHYALWLCFAKLYQFPKRQLNKIPERHLQFYYEDVLKQFPLPPRPNRAHVLFELTKEVDSHLLPEGTLVNGGKDDTGVPINYGLLDDLLVNKAQIVTFKSVYRPMNNYPIAAFKADSLDGIEEPLDKEFPQWKPFFTGKANVSRLEPKARLGFAVADKDLFLKEGEREITLHIDNSIPSSTEHLKAFFTTEEGWEEADIQKHDDHTLKIEVSAALPAFVHFDPEIHVDDDHVDDFGTYLPILKVVLQSGYWDWQEVTFRDIDLKVKATGIKDVLVQNKDGNVDTSTAFTIFGGIPDKLPSAIIGSNEVFSKTLKRFSLQLEWQEAYNTTDYFYSHIDKDFDLRVEYLKGGSWDGQSNFVENMFSPFVEDSQNHTLNFDSIIEGVEFAADQLMENESFSNTSKEGFIRIHVDRQFGHMYYPDEKARELIAIANGETISDPVKEPYPAKVNSLSIDYVTEEHTPSCFFELHPFGFKETNTPTSFIPIIDNTGELYLGLKNLDAPEKVNVLFQVLSGTSDPLAPSPDIKWSYLKDNVWSEIGFEIEDKTDGLSRSGIIAFSFPKEATDNNTLFPKEQYWIRMTVKEHINALNNLISIDAQAALVEFEDQGNDQKFLERSLEAGTISKMTLPQTSIKSVTQKHEGFYGRGSETMSHYYTRVSERLRHKNRCIQIWDYEHVILQNFPHIYRVKCLNHTKLDDYNRPGHVTIVPLPKIESLLKDPTKPYTDKQTRIDIHRFVKARISPFICLHVVQPRLEGIKIECAVQFNEELVDVLFYKERLRQALVQFLTPWAFTSKKDLHFGGKWHKADIINFIDEQPYVSFVKDLKLYHIPNLEDDDIENRAALLDMEVVTASTARSILISDKNHIIEPIEDTLVTVDNGTQCHCENGELI